MTQTIIRYFLEISSINNSDFKSKPSDNYLLNKESKDKFDLNKFFYKQIGKKYRWIDRLVWADNQWIEYVENSKVNTYILKNIHDLIGYFEIIFNYEKNQSEIAYFGILEEYFGKKYGAYMLSEAIIKSFANGIEKVWVHTCSLDHENALKNYKSRGMKIFKTERVNVNIS